MIDLDPAVHGSPYEYDRHVPLIFLGAGVTPGMSDQRARTVDIAPTLAFLAIGIVSLPVCARYRRRAGKPLYTSSFGGC